MALKAHAQGVVPDLLTILRTEEHPEVRARVAQTLGKIGTTYKDEVVPALIQALRKALREKDRKMQVRAAIALGELRKNPEEVIPLLMALLDENKSDPNDKEGVRRAALGLFPFLVLKQGRPFRILWKLQRIARS